MNKELENIFGPYSNIEMDTVFDNEIAVDLSEYTSLVYSKAENKIYIETWSDNYEEELNVPVDIASIQDIKCVDYTVTISDIEQFLDLLKSNGVNL